MAEISKPTFHQGALAANMQALLKVIDQPKDNADYMKFYQYAKANGVSQWLDLYSQTTELEETKDRSPQVLSATAKQIYARFFHHFAPQPVDIDKALFKTVQSACENEDGNIDVRIFHDIRMNAFDFILTKVWADYSLVQFAEKKKQSQERIAKLKLPSSGSENDLLSLSMGKERRSSFLFSPKKKPKSKTTDNFELSSPSSFKHNVHVDTDYNWSGLSNPTEEFDLVKTLGKGSFATVHLGVHKSLGLKVAVKILPVADNVDELRKEMDILKRCKHENTVRYYGCFKLENEVWVMMDYCAGGSSLDVVKTLRSTGKALTEKQLAAILEPVVRGLVYLHSLPIIHRDVKAGNILITETGEVKIADFGVSAQMKGGTDDEKRRTMKGTPLWMAPEVLATDEYDTRADVWSLGITAIELADGVPPHMSMHLMRAMMRIIDGPPPELQNPEVWSTDFKDFVAKCLNKEKSKRPTAAELLKHPFLTNASKDAAKVVRAMLDEKESLQIQKKSSSNHSSSDDNSDDKNNGVNDKKERNEKEKKDGHKKDKQKFSKSISPSKLQSVSPSDLALATGGTGAGASSSSSKKSGPKPEDRPRRFTSPAPPVPSPKLLAKIEKAEKDQSSLSSPLARGSRHSPRSPRTSPRCAKKSSDDTPSHPLGQELVSQLHPELVETITCIELLVQKLNTLKISEQQLNSLSQLDGNGKKRLKEIVNITNSRLEQLNIASKDTEHLLKKVLHNAE